MDKEHIIKIAEDVYKDFVEFYDDKTLEGLCLDCSRDLKKLLAGSIVVQGLFRLDEPDYDEDGEEMYEVLHYWVEYEGYVIDVTSTQFQEFCEDELDDVYIETLKDSYYYKYKPLRKDWK